MVRGKATDKLGTKKEKQLAWEQKRVLNLTFRIGLLIKVGNASA